MAKEKTLINYRDDWNAYISMLSASMNNRTGSNITRKRLSYQQLDNWYSSNSIAAKICNKPAEHMIKEGLDIDHKKADKIIDLYEKYDIYSILENALKYENVYGGSLIILDIDDGLEDWTEPLNINNIRSLNDIFVVDRYFVTPYDYSYLKEPKYYSLNDSDLSFKKIHKSRVIRFDGIDSGIRNRYKNQSFGESRIYRCITELENYNNGHDVIPEILSRFVEDIFKFKDMTKFINSDDKRDLVLKKVEYLKTKKNILKALVIDQEDDFISKTLNVSGLDKLIDMIERRLCAAAEIPHTHLLEEGTSAGLSNNGDNTQESKQWYDWIKSQQVKKLTKPINTINSIFASILGLGKNNSIKWEFNPLQQQTQAEIIDNRLKQSTIDSQFVELGIPKELIIEKRLGSGYYSHETNFTSEEINIIKTSIENGRNNTNNLNTNNNANSTNTIAEIQV